MDAARLQVVVGSDTAQAEAGLQRVNSLVEGYGQRISGLAAGISFAVANVAIQGLQSALGAAGGAILNFNGQLEQAQIGFTNLLGSGERASAFLQQLRDFAQKTPFEFPELLQASRLLTGLGVAAESVIPLMTDIGNALASMGQISGASINQATLAIGQMIARTKVSAQEMNQLANVGIQGWKILAEATGQPIPVLMKLAEAGQISANTFINAFHKVMTDGRIGQFMEEQSQTFLGALSNVKDGMRNLVAAGFEPFFTVVRNATVALGNFLISDQAKAFGADLAATMQQVVSAVTPVGEAIQRAFSAAQGGGIGAALQSLVSDISAFGQSLFGAGWTMMQSLAQGITSGAASLISQAAEYVASLIASFLVGQSPPPSGPLAQIDQAGRQLIETYVSAFGDADLSPVEAVAGRIAAVMGNKDGLQAQAAAVAATVDQISDAMRRLQDETGAERREIQSVKDEYAPIIEALQGQIDKINDVNDLLTRQQDIQRELRGLEIDKKVEQAKGDPVLRAQIAGARESIKLRKEDLSNQIQALSLSNKHGENDKKIAALRQQMNKLSGEDLGLQQRLAGLVDKVALAQATRDKALLDSEATSARIVKKQEELNRAQQTAPLEQKIKDAQKAEKDLIKPHEVQLKLLADQLDAIRMQQQAYQDLGRTIQRALGQIKTETGAAKAAGGAGAKLPGAGGLDLPKIDITARAKQAGEEAGQSLLTGIQTRIQQNAPALVGGALGAVLGGAVFGPLGALAGASFGSQLATAIQQKIPDIGARIQTLGQILMDAIQTVVQVFQGNWTPDPSTINPFVEKVGEIALVIRDQVLPVVQSFIGFLQTNWQPIVAGVIATLATFTILSTVASLVTTVTAAFTAFSVIATALGGIMPVIIAALGGPITIAIAALAVAVGLLAAAWVTNFGNIQGVVAQLAAQAAPALAAFGVVVSTAFQNLLATTQPILDQMTTSAATAFQQLSVNAGPALDQLVAVFTTALNLLTTTIVQPALAFIQLLWDEHGQAVLTSITTIWQTIQLIVGIFLIGLQLVIQVTLLTIEQLWLGHGAQILAIFTAAWALLTAALAINLELMATAITVALQLISGNWTGAWTTIQTGFATIWGLMKTVVTSSIAIIQSTLALAWAGIQKGAETGWAAVLKVVTDAVAGVGVQAERLNQTITNTLASAFQSLAGATQPAVQAILSVLDAAKSLLNFLETTVFRFKIELPQLPSWATPGSPTPFQLGLEGIAGAMRDLGRVSMSTLGGLPSPMMPAMAGGGGGGITFAPGSIIINGDLVHQNQLEETIAAAVDSARRGGRL